MVRPAHHERENINVFKTNTIHPEPFDLAQDRPVEGFMPFGHAEAVFQHPANPLCLLGSGFPFTPSGRFL